MDTTKGWRATIITYVVLEVSKIYSSSKLYWMEVLCTCDHSVIHRMYGSGKSFIKNNEASSQNALSANNTLNKDKMSCIIRPFMTSFVAIHS